MARLAEKDRVRSIFIVDSRGLATTVFVDEPLASYTFQDDVTVIGAEVTIEISAVDAHLNADLFANMAAELSRQAIKELPGTILRADLITGWTGILGPGGGMAKNVVMMFPEGKGIEIDEGEVLNLLGELQYIGAGGALTVTCSALVWYTER